MTDALDSEAATGAAPEFSDAAMCYPESQALIREIEALTGVPLVVYWNSYAGSVCADDVRVLRSVLGVLGPRKRLAILIKSDGGNGVFAMQMAALLRTYCRQLDAYLPLDAHSAATMLALGAERLYIGPIGSLSAVDTTSEHGLAPKGSNDEPVNLCLDDLKRAMRLWREAEPEGSDSNPWSEMFRHLHPLAVGRIDRASSLSKRLCNDILALHMKDSERRQRICERLDSDYPTHTYPIRVGEARDIGLNARPMDAKLETLLIRLTDLYSTMGQKRRTDFNIHHYRRSDVRSAFEVIGRQIHYLDGADGVYCTQAKRWLYPNNRSGWRTVEGDGAAYTVTDTAFR